MREAAEVADAEKLLKDQRVFEVVGIGLKV